MATYLHGAWTKLDHIYRPLGRSPSLWTALWTFLSPARQWAHAIEIADNVFSFQDHKKDMRRIFASLVLDSKHGFKFSLGTVGMRVLVRASESRSQYEPKHSEPTWWCLPQGREHTGPRLMDHVGLDVGVGVNAITYIASGMETFVLAIGGGG